MMIRSLVASMVVSTAIGFGLGFLLAGALGGILGIGLGMVFALLLASSREAVEEVHDDTNVHREHERLLCVPKGQVADCVLLRDDDSGRWVDVERCSLSRPPTVPTCAKRCLVFMNDLAPKRRRRRARPRTQPAR
jgi:hypothetical protein